MKLIYSKVPFSTAFDFSQNRLWLLRCLKVDIFIGENTVLIYYNTSYATNNRSVFCGCEVRMAGRRTKGGMASLNFSPY